MTEFKIKEIPHCVWTCYGSVCPNTFINPDGVCNKHAEDKCWCGLQSVSGCGYCGQFVCGAPLCKTHVGYCPTHGGDQPPVVCKECGQDLKKKKD